MNLFCWVEGDIVPVDKCFGCIKIDTCKQYGRLYSKSESAIDILKKKWDKLEPELEIIIRRKKMVKKSNAGDADSSGKKKEQMYIYTYKQKDNKTVSYSTGTEQDILKLYKSGGIIDKVHKLGDEMEVVVKIQKKLSL